MNIKEIFNFSFSSVSELIQTKYSTEELRPVVIPNQVDKVLAEMGLAKNDYERVVSLFLSTRDPIDLITTKLGIVSEFDIINIFSKIYQMDKFGIDENIFEIQVPAGLSRQFFLHHRILPCIKDGIDFFLVVDPTQTISHDVLRKALNKAPQIYLIRHSEWEKLSAALDKSESRDNEEHQENNQDLSDDVARLKDLASEEPIIRRVNRLLHSAVEQFTTDIHIEPEKRQGVIKFRIDGVLSARDSITTEIAIAMTSRIKILANLDIAERRLPQDGRFSFPVEGRDVDIRVSTIPTDFGESLVLRLLDKSKLNLSFSALGFDDDLTHKLLNTVIKPHGIFLVTGPTGSGKTTTLYSILAELKKEQRKIITIEDPIEYRLDGICQSQAKHNIGYSFANALRAFLRHDPDVIMVGEIRDLETAQIAIQAALTGHLVLSTLHTNSAPAAITRLLDMGVDDYLLSATLNGVLAQRLVRKTHKGTNGCTIYRGRTVVCELLSINDTLKGLIKSNMDIFEFVRSARDHGYVDLQNHGKKLIEAGITDETEILKITI